MHPTSAKSLCKHQPSSSSSSHHHHTSATSTSRLLLCHPRKKEKGGEVPAQHRHCAPARPFPQIFTTPSSLPRLHLTDYASSLSSLSEPYNEPRALKKKIISFSSISISPVSPLHLRQSASYIASQLLPRTKNKKSQYTSPCILQTLKTLINGAYSLGEIFHKERGRLFR